MKALRIHLYGNPSSVQVDNVAIPKPNSGEVRIRVKAAGLNNSDLQTTYGTYRGYGHQGLPHILGQEASGIVDSK